MTGCVEAVPGTRVDVSWRDGIRQEFIGLSNRKVNPLRKVLARFRRLREPLK
jgi:hypothetical protein